MSAQPPTQRHSFAIANRSLARPRLLSGCYQTIGRSAELRFAVFRFGSP